MEKEEREKGREQLIRENPSLLQLDPNGYDSLKKGSRNLKTELQKAYPGIKFSVRSDSYSGGCHIAISWTDGPTNDQVEKISGKYQEGHFDGMIDCYEYNRDDIWTDLFGGAKYVQPSRSYSGDAYHWAVRKVEKDWGVEIKISESSYGSLYVAPGDDSLIQNSNRRYSWEVNGVLSERDFTRANEEIEAEEKAEAERFEVEFKASESRRIKAIEEAMEKGKETRTEPTPSWSDPSY